MAHDVFISYSAHDKATADAVCAALEDAKIRCWMAPRDIVPGATWGESIIDAITGARVMVVVLSAESNNSSQVMREVQNAVQEGIVVVPFRIENVTPTKAMRYFLGSQHWLDALTPPLERHLGYLCRTIQSLLAGPPQGRRAGAETPAGDTSPSGTLAGAEPAAAAAPSRAESNERFFRQLAELGWADGVLTDG